MREALFSILASSFGGVSGARVLDLFAGTGALAFESLSRGAAHATLVEKNDAALRAIRATAKDLGVDRDVTVVAQPVERALAGRMGPFDLVFADPPYAAVADGSAPRALAALAARGLVTAASTVVLEHAHADAAPAIEGLVLDGSRRYGDTAVSFYRVEASDDVTHVDER